MLYKFRKKISVMFKMITIKPRLVLAIVVLVGTLTILPWSYRSISSLYYQVQAGKAIDLINNSGNEKVNQLYTCEAFEDLEIETEEFVRQIIVDLNRSISFTPGYSHSYLQLGRLYCMLDEPERAVEYYQRYVELRPENPLGHLEIGFVFAELGEAERAIIHWDLAGINFSDFHQLGLSALNDDAYEEALLWLTRTTWLNSNFPDAWINIAEVYKGKNDPDNALKALWEAYRINPEFGVLPLVEHLVEFGEISESIELLFAALDEYPESKNRLNWWTMLVDSLMEMQAWQQAIDVYQDAIAEYPEEMDLYISLGWLYYDYLEDFTSALNLFNQAVEIDPERGAGYYAVGVLLNNEERYDEAESWLAEAVEREPSRTWYILVRANNLRSGDCILESIDIYKSILDENPKYDRAYFELSLAYYQLEEMELARDAIMNAITYASSPGQAYFNRAAIIHEALGDYESAIYFFEKALEINLNNATAIEGIRRVYRKIEDQ
jgi:tetratricopeptide (TPR) repeat protein